MRIISMPAGTKFMGAMPGTTGPEHQWACPVAAETRPRLRQFHSSAQPIQRPWR